MRQAFLSGCFEVRDETVISPVIHDEKEKEAKTTESRRASGETERK